MSENNRLPTAIQIEGNCGNLSVNDNIFENMKPIGLGRDANVERLEFHGNRSFFRYPRRRLSPKDEAGGRPNFDENIKRSPIGGWLTAKAIELGANIATMLAFAKDVFLGR